MGASPYRNHTLTSLARLSPKCFGCGAHNDGSVVAAHANEGKGMGCKNPDFMVAFLGNNCCHMPLDQGKDMSRDDRRTFWMRAFWATQEWLWTSGHVAAHLTPQPQPVPPPPIKVKIRSGRKLTGGAKIASRAFEKPTAPRKIASRPFPKRAP